MEQDHDTRFHIEMGLAVSETQVFGLNPVVVKSGTKPMFMISVRIFPKYENI